jgi:hypothetical protein
MVSLGISIFYALDLGAKKLLYSFPSKIKMFCAMTGDFL